MKREALALPLQLVHSHLPCCTFLLRISSPILFWVCCWLLQCTRRVLSSPPFFCTSVITFSACSVSLIFRHSTSTQAATKSLSFALLFSFSFLRHLPQARQEKSITSTQKRIFLPPIPKPCLGDKCLLLSLRLCSLQLRLSAL